MHSEEEYYHKADNLIQISCYAAQGVFRDKWKQVTGTEWTEASAKDFISGPGKVFYSQCKTKEKRMLEEGKVEKWDLCLLSGIFDIKGFAFTDVLDITWQVTQIHLRLLGAEGDLLAANFEKKISAANYQRVEDSVRKSLSLMGISNKILDKWISQAGVTSPSDDIEEATKILKLGAKEFSKGNYQEAVRHYDDAILVTNLLPWNMSTLYEKRAACFLKWSKREKDEEKRTLYLAEAMADVMEALNNNGHSWKAHSILAKIYKTKNEVDKAIQHFTRALALSPAQPDLKEELDDCKLVNGSMVREDHTNPKTQPQSMNQAAEHYSRSLGFTIPSEKLFKLMKYGDQILPGLPDVFAGHQCANGWNVEKNYQEAARHYEKAMAKGNAEGIYNLALLYQLGNGVEKDLGYAIRLLKEAANMTEIVLVKGTWQLDLGVRAAQHSLGFKYHKGVGLKQDFEKAAEWYRKAASSGCGHAANNLAILYLEGKGVTRDLKVAEMYWKKAAEQGNVNAAQSLCNYYLNEVEPKMSKLWLEKASQVGPNRMAFVKGGLMKKINRTSELRNKVEPILRKFEEAHKLKRDGLTFRERQDRMEVEEVCRILFQLRLSTGGLYGA